MSLHESICKYVNVQFIFHNAATGVLCIIVEHGAICVLKTFLIAFFESYEYIPWKIRIIRCGVSSIMNIHEIPSCSWNDKILLVRYFAVFLDIKFTTTNFHSALSLWERPAKTTIFGGSPSHS